MEKLVRPLFIGAYIAFALAVCVQLGLGLFGASGRELTAESIAAVQAGFDKDPPSAAEIRAAMPKVAPPGYGIRYLGLVDGILLLSMTWMLLALFIPQSVQGQVQGIVTLLVAISLLAASLLSLLTTFTTLITMVCLSLAQPFGFAAYLAKWGSFNVGAAKAILSLSMFLKIVFAVLLMLSNQRFLKIKSLVMLIGTSLVLNLIVAFLISLVPSFLASITDAIAGIVDAIVGLIWAAILAVTSVLGILRAIRVDRSLAESVG